MLTGKTGNLAVIGWPIAHSLSPAMQNAALKKAGLDYVYISLSIPPEKLHEAVSGLRAMNFRGFNVTLPHKTDIMKELDEIDQDARMIGAVNTVVNEQGVLKGYNTDVTGFLHALHERNFALQGKQAAVLGAGGAARAVLWGLLKSGMKRIDIGVRNPEKAEKMVRSFGKRGEGVIFVHEWKTENFSKALSAVDLLVNTTPLGMAPKTDNAPPVPWKAVKEGALVYDIIYTPRSTLFLQEAERYGHPIQNGEDMLVGQGAEAFHLWFGQEPDRGLMKEVLRAQLQAD